MLTSREPGRSVAHLPELLSASHQNRVRKLSPRNRNQGVHDQPESHMTSKHVLLQKIATIRVRAIKKDDVVACGAKGDSNPWPLACHASQTTCLLGHQWLLPATLVPRSARECLPACR